MINYDIPWNPVRLEQRMGRIHRYGQEKDCLIFNFVATNTREGRVLQKLLERLREIEHDLDEAPARSSTSSARCSRPTCWRSMFREMYARNLTEDVIEDRIVEEVDPERFRQITESTLEGLAKRELNLSAIVGKSAEAKERRLVPEVIEDFFVEAAPDRRHPSQGDRRRTSHVYRLGKVPRTLWPIGERLEPRFGKLGREYKQIVFDKTLLTDDPTLEWVTPGHPLFEAVREDVLERVRDDLRARRGLLRPAPQGARTASTSSRPSIKDGRGNSSTAACSSSRRHSTARSTVRQPTIFLDLVPAPPGRAVPDGDGLPDRDARRAVPGRAGARARSLPKSPRERDARRPRRSRATSRSASTS